MKLYRQVSTSERMPEKDGYYMTDEGFLQYDNKKSKFIYYDNYAGKNRECHSWWW